MTFELEALRKTDSELVGDLQEMAARRDTFPSFRADATFRLKAEAPDLTADERRVLLSLLWRQREVFDA